MLHITNGDSAAQGIRESGVPGRVLPWRDVLHEGPVPQGLSLEEMSEVRSQFLAQPGWAESVDEVVREFRERDQALKSGLAEDEIVLWFEADLYDQLQIIQILDWLGRQATPRGSMICIGEYPGLPGFQGLGELTGEQLGGLFPSRRVIGAPQLALATRAWKAFTSPNPALLNRMAREDTGALEFLGPSLLRLLAEYPLWTTGLGETERSVLRVLAAGPMTFDRLFPAVQGMEERPFMGDTTLYTRILQLCRGPRPAVTIEDSLIGITPFGLDCHQGKEDFIRANGIDRWLGGVHLTSESHWRWDPRARQVGEFPARSG
jgi:hypothetical protein